MILYSILSLICLGLIALAIMFSNEFFKPEADGVITVEVVDVSGEIIKSKEIEFNNEDILRDLIKDNFSNFEIEEGQYGAYVKKIESISENNDEHIYIALYVNNEYGDGLDKIIFEDGTIISFRETKW